VILTNPPYVNEKSMRELPPEYMAEPRIALAGGDDGMDVVRRIIAGAKKRLNPGGVLVVEIGNEHENVETAFPDLDIVWLSVSAGDEQVFLVTYDALPG
jgi:ribosomal protein L3 glutamine methyltransferase